MNMLPNFIIVGATKSGTSSLLRYLGKHPDILTGGQQRGRKEAGFFNNNYEKGIEWYEQFFEDWNGEKAIGEKSVGYMIHKESPERIKKLIPDIKIIFVLRNPVDRAYSQYWHDCIRHSEKEVISFEEAIKRAEDVDPKREEYLRIGRYCEHIKYWRKFFPKENMLILKTEDLNKKGLKDVLRFLNVNESFDFGELKKHNIGGSPRSKRLATISRNRIVTKTPYLYGFMSKIINQKKGRYSEMNKETRKKLQEYYKPYNEELEKITGLDIKEWE